jgi:probable phosphoglycerate mutase
MIFLIRHGETASNAARIVQTPDVPLSDRGMAQAKRLAARLAAEGISEILSSDLLRAQMTATEVRATTGAALRFEPLLQERNYGDIRGRAYAEIGADILSPEYEPPGGERWEEFHARVDAAWIEIRGTAERTAGSLAVITHGLVCYSLATRHLTLPARKPLQWHWGNASVTIIDSRPPWTVRLLNCTAHLDTATVDDPGASSTG